MKNRFRFHGTHFVGDELAAGELDQQRGYGYGNKPQSDNQVPRGRLVLSLPANRFAIEQDGDEYHIFDFGQAADPNADPTTQAVARFEAGLSKESATLSHDKIPATTDRMRDAARIRALQKVFNRHDWTGHGK